MSFIVTVSAKHYFYEPFTGSLKYFSTKKLSLKHISLNRIYDNRILRGKKKTGFKRFKECH